MTIHVETIRISCDSEPRPENCEIVVDTDTTETAQAISTIVDLGWSVLNDEHYCAFCTKTRAALEG